MVPSLRDREADLLDLVKIKPFLSPASLEIPEKGEKEKKVLGGWHGRRFLKGVRFLLGNKKALLRINEEGL